MGTNNNNEIDSKNNNDKKLSEFFKNDGNKGKSESNYIKII